jgi:hypothetical protein
MARPTKYKPVYCKKIKDFVGKEGKSIVEFARLLEVNTDTIYEWKKVHPKFSDAFYVAKEWSKAFWMERLRLRNDMMDSKVNTGLYKLYLYSRFGMSDKAQEVKDDDGLLEAIKELKKAAEDLPV